MNATLPGTAPAFDQLRHLANNLAQQPGFIDATAALRQRQPASFDGVWGSSCALVAEGVRQHVDGPLLLVAATMDAAEQLHDDLVLFSRSPRLLFPAWESQREERVIHDDVNAQRLSCLKQLLDDQTSEPPSLLLTSIQSLLQPVPDANTIRSQSRRLRS